MPTYFSLTSLLVRDYPRSEQRITIEHDATPFSVPPDEWRLLNETNLAWMTKVLSNAMQKPIEDEAWFARAIRFSEYLQLRLDGSFEESDEFTFNEPF